MSDDNENDVERNNNNNNNNNNNQNNIDHINSACPLDPVDGPADSIHENQGAKRSTGLRFAWFDRYSQPSSQDKIRRFLDVAKITIWIVLFLLLLLLFVDLFVIHSNALLVIVGVFVIVVLTIGFALHAITLPSS
jgi:hypothetical protein